MIRIAVVEDEPLISEQIQKYISRYASESGRSIDIKVYSDGDEIVERYEPCFDIILMDIQMKFMDGMTSAKIIREKDPEVIIIFITNMAQYAIKGYSVNALDFILKPVQYFSFCQKLNHAITKMKKRNSDSKYIILQVDGGARKIQIEEICYIESQGHKLIYHTVNGQYIRNYSTMREAEERFTPYNFFRCNKGYLVNLAQVDGFMDGCAVINGERVIVSRVKKAPFLEALTKFVGDGVN